MTDWVNLVLQAGKNFPNRFRSQVSVQKKQFRLPAILVVKSKVRALKRTKFASTFDRHKNEQNFGIIFI